MPININYPNFLNAPLQESPAANLFENLLKGYKMGREPARMAAEEKDKALATQLKQMEAEHKPKEYELSDEAKTLANSLQSKANEHYEAKNDLERRYKEALIKKALRAPAAGAAGGPKANGILANYIVSHPGATQEDVQKFADRLLETQLQHTAEGTKRTTTLNETQNDRAPRSSIEKKHHEISEIDKGYEPYSDGKVKLTPQQQTEYRNDLLLGLVKDTTDQQTRAKLQNAVNMNITLDSINSEALTHYSGIERGVTKLFDQVQEGLDVGTPEYKAYVKEAIKASAAAKQMRQYLGDSIQPSNQERLDKLLKPEAWNVSPKVARENFEFMRDLMKRESNTLVRAATDPTIYRPQAATPTQGKVFNLSSGGYE